MKKLIILCISVVLALANFSFAHADESVMSEKFVLESKLSTTLDDKGEKVILLTNVEEVPINFRAVGKTYARTTVAILGSTEQETIRILEEIQNFQRGSGTYTQDEWFYGSSVYLSSTLYYTTQPINEAGDSIALDKVNIDVRTNSGSTVSSMTLTMIQHGPCVDGKFRTQSKEFNAKTARTFAAPSSWYAVDMTSPLAAVGAKIDCTATRPNGDSSSFSLPNNIIG